jgi:hypothetical protein
LDSHGQLHRQLTVSVAMFAEILLQRVLGGEQDSQQEALSQVAHVLLSDFRRIDTQADAGAPREREHAAVDTPDLLRDVRKQVWCPGYDAVACCDIEVCLQGVQLALGTIVRGLTTVHAVQVRELTLLQVEDRENPMQLAMDGEQDVRDWIFRCELSGQRG